MLLENLGPAEQLRRRLTPREVQQRHPHLVHLTISDFGLSGPRAGWRLEPLTAFAASGALHASGFPHRPPCWLPGYLAHDCASIFGVVGVLAAVLDRARHGSGQTVEVSVQEAALNGLDPWSIPLADYARLYPLFPTSVPRDGDGVYLVLPTRDGYVRAVLGTPRQARGLCPPALGRSRNDRRRRAPTELLESSDAEAARPTAPSADVLPSASARVAALAGALVAGERRGARRVPDRAACPGLTLSLTHALARHARSLAARALRSRARDEVLATALRLGVPMAPVNTPEEFVAAEQTRARGYFRETGFPHLGGGPFASAPWRLSATPAELRRAAPTPARTTRRFRSAPRPTTAGQRRARRPRPRCSRGLRVINLGVAAVGPELCWLLGELGAEVIKIESGAHLDLLRSLTPELDNPNTSFPVQRRRPRTEERLPRSEPPRGRELALQLCASADVVVENHRGGAVRAWGLDYPARQRSASGRDLRLVAGLRCEAARSAKRPPSGRSTPPFAGATWLWNHPDAPYPAGSSLNHPDHIASKLGAVAVLAALEHRRRTGEGQFIEMAQTEAVAYLMGEFYLELAATARPTRQRGNDVDYACPHGVYPCAGDDRWCAIAVVGDDAWQRFCGALGWVEEPRLATLEGRLGLNAELNARVAEWTRARTPTRRPRPAVGRRLGDARAGSGRASRRSAPRGARSARHRRPPRGGCGPLHRKPASHEPHADVAARGCTEARGAHARDPDWCPRLERGRGRCARRAGCVPLRRRPDHRSSRPAVTSSAAPIPPCRVDLPRVRFGTGR